MELVQNWKKFCIPDSMWKETAKLLINTESMTDEEKSYWFDLWENNMSRQQRWRLHEILDNERIKIEELETEFYNKILSLRKQNV